MRVGLVVRADNRGLANQTWEVYRHLPHDKVLVIRDPGSEKQGFKPHLERFPGAQVTVFGRYKGGGLDQVACRRFLADLDVVYSAETFYDWNFCTWAKEMGVATVLHANPEFYFHWREPDTPSPSMWWSATPWRLDHMPSETRVVPMPIPIDRWAEPDFDHNPRQVMHVGGLEAIRDRNGTEVVTQVARHMDHVEFLVNLQDRRHNDFIHLRSVENYWEMYENTAPICLLPRRYGGLCLPAIEALGAGKLVVMPAVSPNTEAWPVAETYPAREEPRPLTTQGGDIRVWQSPSRVVVEKLEELLQDEEALAERRRKSYAWAVEHSWPNMVDFWMSELELATNA